MTMALAETVINAISVSNTFILLIFDFVIEQYPISLPTTAFFFSAWTLVTFLSYLCLVSLDLG